MRLMNAATVTDYDYDDDDDGDQEALEGFLSMRNLELNFWRKRRSDVEVL